MDRARSHTVAPPASIEGLMPTGVTGQLGGEITQELKAESLITRILISRAH
jgi:hypothetical protein